MVDTMTTITTTKTQDIHEVVRERYSNAAKQAATNNADACCGGEATPLLNDAWGAAMYGTNDLATLPDMAVLASLGCGNPTALAQLHPGEIVLDLGSGGGIDVLLSAKRVGPTGFAYGLDMTDEMLALANANKAQAGATNVVFLKGQIEAVPLPANTVDVIISNCVVNLSPDKDAVLREAYRVLKPGGRVAISDVVVRDAQPGEVEEIPAAVRRSMELWSGCVAGALEARDYRTKLAAAGFTDIEIVEVKRYSLEDLTATDCCSGTDCGCAPDTMTVDGLTEAVASRFTSAFVRATKMKTADVPTMLVPLPMLAPAEASACGCGTSAVAVAGECCDDKAACCGEGSTCC